MAPFEQLCRLFEFSCAGHILLRELFVCHRRGIRRQGCRSALRTQNRLQALAAHKARVVKQIIDIRADIAAKFICNGGVEFGQGRQAHAVAIYLQHPLGHFAVGSGRIILVEAVDTLAQGRIVLHGGHGAGNLAELYVGHRFALIQQRAAGIATFGNPLLDIRERGAVLFEAFALLRNPLCKLCLLLCATTLHVEFAKGLVHSDPLLPAVGRTAVFAGVLYLDLRVGQHILQQYLLALAAAEDTHRVH